MSEAPLVLASNEITHQSIEMGFVFLISSKKAIALTLMEYKMLPRAYGHGSEVVFPLFLIMLLLVLSIFLPSNPCSLMIGVAMALGVIIIGSS